MSIDREKLEKAVRLEFTHEINGDLAKISTDVFYLFLDVAKAHLGTLPVKMWGVNSGCGWVHFDHLSDAIDALRVEAKAGRAVTIEYRVWT